MNILTFDIEEWAHSRAGGFATAEKIAEYDALLGRILDVLDVTGIRGTFFCTGMMGRFFPQVVRRIQSRGHEIGCHSHSHTWMNKMSEKEARNDTFTAIDSLEQCIGQKIHSYRAPAFSIGENNKWMIEVLSENGITRDASIFPAVRDFGGFPGFGAKIPCIVEYRGGGIKEFPICTTRLLGRDFAYSGGGYFRFFPLRFISYNMEKSEYTMCYFHIGDLVPELLSVPSRDEYEEYYKEPGTIKNRYIRYMKTNFGKKGALEKLFRLIQTSTFMNLDQADTLIDWTKAPIIVI